MTLQAFFMQLDMCLILAPFSCLPTYSFPFYFRMLSMLEDGLTKYRVLSDCTRYNDVNKNILQTCVIICVDLLLLHTTFELRFIEVL